MSKHHELRASAETVRLGAVDRADEPVLTIASGDTVSLDTWNAWGNQVTPETTIEDVANYVSAAAPAGPHDLTGPIAIHGASAGDVLQIDLLDLRLRKYAFNLSLPGHLGIGLLAEDFAEGQIYHYELSETGSEAWLKFAPGIRVPIRPFFGYMGVAPRDEGLHSSIPPGLHGGNIDVPDLVVGSTLYLPVWAKGALFYVGDTHAAQGYGEVNLTALEASAEEAVLRFTLHQGGKSLNYPRAETPAELINMSFGTSLVDAAKSVTRDMVTEISQSQRVSESQAYALCSMALDLKLSQVVNSVMGVQASISKELFSDGGLWFHERFLGSGAGSLT